MRTVIIQAVMPPPKSKGRHLCEQISVGGEHADRGNDSHCCGYGMPKFVKTQTDKQGEQKDREITERRGDTGYLCSCGYQTGYGQWGLTYDEVEWKSIAPWEWRSSISPDQPASGEWSGKKQIGELPSGPQEHPGTAQHPNDAQSCAEAVE